MYSAGSVIKSTSYYVQQLFATNLGDQYLPSTLPTRGGTLHWSITRSSSSGATFIKAWRLQPHMNMRWDELTYRNDDRSLTLEVLPPV